MKILIFSLLLITGCASNSINKNNKHFVALLDLKRSSGTANVVRYNNKDFILTNEHVCHPIIADGNSYDISLNFEDRTLSYKVLQKDIIVDEDKDLCLIRVHNLHGFDIKPLLNNKSRLLSNYYIQYDTLNRGDFLNVERVSGFFEKIESDLEFMSSSSFGMVRTYPFNVLTYTIDTHPGDSGSLAYNKDGQIVGMVFGNLMLRNQIISGYVIPVEYLQEFFENNVK
jgi:S1-C subfamily serine protease